MNNNMPLVPISIGELLDKITILKIKKLKIKDTIKLENINKELELLLQTVSKLRIDKKKMYEEYMYTLYETNNCLWNIENQLREFEAKQQFDDWFIETARKVYEFNDKRARLKKEINQLYGSDLVEEKSYDSISFRQN